MSDTRKPSPPPKQPPKSKPVPPPSKPCKEGQEIPRPPLPKPRDK